MIDMERVRLRIVNGLPEHVRWYVKGSSLDSHFHRARRDLRPIAGDDLNGCEIPEEWLCLYLFGDQDWDEAGGSMPFLGVHAETGQVFGLDVESNSEPLYLLSSDVDRFVAMFDLFDQVLRQKTVPIEQLAPLAQAIDPEVFVPDREWYSFAEYVASDDDDDIEEEGGAAPVTNP